MKITGYDDDIQHFQELDYLAYDLYNYQEVTKHVVYYVLRQSDNQILKAILEKELLTSKPFYCSDRSLVNF